MPFSAFVEAVKRGDFMSIPRQVTRPNHSARSLARGLGWFSIGLGVVQLLAPRQVSRFIGMPGSEGMIRACGVREIATGIGILMADDPKPWIYGRVGGDALDLAGLGATAVALPPGRNRCAAASGPSSPPPAPSPTGIRSRCTDRCRRAEFIRPLHRWPNEFGPTGSETPGLEQRIFC